MRRIQIIQGGLETEFWKVLKESVEYWCMVKSVEVVNLQLEDRNSESRNLANEIGAARRMIEEPYMILRMNRSLVDKMKDMINDLKHKKKENHPQESPVG